MRFVEISLLREPLEHDRENNAVLFGEFVLGSIVRILEF